MCLAFNQALSIADPILSSQLCGSHFRVLKLGKKIARKHTEEVQMLPCLALNSLLSYLSNGGRQATSTIITKQLPSDLALPL